MIVIIPILTFIILFIFVYIDYKNKRKPFGGKCPECNSNLKYVYKDNEDRKHYKCPRCGYEVFTIVFDEN